MDEKSLEFRNVLTKGCSIATLCLYIIIAILLVVIAIVAVIDAVIATIGAIKAVNNMFITDIAFTTVNAALQSVLLVIVIVTLIDMVKSYIKVGRILVRPILIAGITTMVRRLLISDSSSLETMIGVAVVIFVLAFALYFLGREDRKIAECVQAHRDEEKKEHQENEGQQDEKKKKKLFAYDEI